jgi:hypothetical protein
MSLYLLLLHEAAPGAHPAMSAEEMQKIIERYKAWADRMRREGRLAGGEKLADGAGRVLKRSGAKVHVTDGPFAETKDVIGGYFLLTAASFEEAVELSRDCPHLDFGAIEIREIERV